MDYCGNHPQIFIGKLKLANEFIYFKQDYHKMPGVLGKYHGAKKHFIQIVTPSHFKRR